MQQLKTKIKPPFLLDGVSAARRGKVLDYKAEKDTHLEQYFFNMQMRQQMMKMKQDRMSQRNLAHQQSKSFEQTIHQQKQTQVLNKSNSPQHQTKVSNTQKVPNVSRSLSKEHFVTFLDSFITTVQNVQQLVNTYFPQDQMDNQISKQQDELRKISQATEQLSRKLRANSLGNKKEVENVKTQKNFSKLPQIKKIDALVSKSQRGRDQQYKVNNQVTKNIANVSKTLERNQNIELEETENHNFRFEHYESVQDNTIKKTITDKPVDQILSHRDPDSQQSNLLQIRSDQTTQLPSVRSSQQKPVYQYKKYHKEIQLVLTKPKQHKNEVPLIQQSPEQFKSKSVGTRDNLQKSQSKNLQKLDFKKITSINISKIEQQKSKKNLNYQEVSSKQQNTPPILIKITDIDKQSNVDQPKNQVQVEVVEDVVQNFSNDSGLFLIQQSQNQEKPQISTQDEDKSKLNGTAFFKIVEEEERKDNIGKMTESNEIQRFNLNDENKEKQSNYQEIKQENAFIKMIQNQVTENDQKLLKQQQTNYNTFNDVENGSEVLIKVAESIDPQSDEDVVNPLEDSDDQQRYNQGTFLITTLEQNNKQQAILQQKDNFEQES
ncbi:unnamed protein product [Paramecium pentaurelia]|uniref:Uncharacterized protein n=1 Tax=Paramecium pentaurelia TaxID=43138 RepID=A0A8S1V1Y6_9CILI|nr:unnamed protein product [Paramecium pentaurelia]